MYNEMMVPCCKIHFQTAPSPHLACQAAMPASGARMHGLVPTKHCSYTEKQVITPTDPPFRPIIIRMYTNNGHPPSECTPTKEKSAKGSSGAPADHEMQAQYRRSTACRTCNTVHTRVTHCPHPGGRSSGVNYINVQTWNHLEEIRDLGWHMQAQAAAPAPSLPSHPASTPNRLTLQ